MVNEEAESSGDESGSGALTETESPGNARYYEALTTIVGYLSDKIESGTLRKNELEKYHTARNIIFDCAISEMVHESPLFTMAIERLDITDIKLTLKSADVKTIFRRYVE